MGFKDHQNRQGAGWKHASPGRALGWVCRDDFWEERLFSATTSIASLPTKRQTLPSAPVFTGNASKRCQRYTCHCHLLLTIWTDFSKGSAKQRQNLSSDVTTPVVLVTLGKLDLPLLRETCPIERKLGPAPIFSRQNRTCMIQPDRLPMPPTVEQFVK